MSALVVEGLSYAYGGRAKALDDVSLEAPAGRFTALLGPNGAGKTTLMALITGLFASPTGRVSVAGQDLRADPGAALAKMGVVFQRPTLDLDLSVDQNLFYAARLYGLNDRCARAAIEEQAERLGFVERRRQAVRALSGGMRRRVELARALLHRPTLLVLDEPTVGLDIDARRAIVDHVHALCREQGLAALWTTHLVDEIGEEDRIVVIAKGRARAEGEVLEIAPDGLEQAYRALSREPEPAEDAAR